MVKKGTLKDLVFLRNSNSEGKQTPLMKAIQASNLATIDILLGFGAKVKDKDANGNTPLHYALG